MLSFGSPTYYFKLRVFGYPAYVHVKKIKLGWKWGNAYSYVMHLGWKEIGYDMLIPIRWVCYVLERKWVN